MSVITFLHFCCVPSTLLQHSRWLSETILPSASFSPSHCHSIIQGTTLHFLLISSSLFLHLSKYHCLPSLRLWELISNCCDSRSYVVFELSLNLQTLTEWSCCHRSFMRVCWFFSWYWNVDVLTRHWSVLSFPVWLWRSLICDVL